VVANGGAVTLGCPATAPEYWRRSEKTTGVLKRSQTLSLSLKLQEERSFLWVYDFFLWNWFYNVFVCLIICAHDSRFTMNPQARPLDLRSNSRWWTCFGIHERASMCISMLHQLWAIRSGLSQDLMATMCFLFKSCVYFSTWLLCSSFLKTFCFILSGCDEFHCDQIWTFWFIRRLRSIQSDPIVFF